MATVVVIGSGPAGIMAALAAADKHNTILLEKNEKIGKKLYISGKGRCNITNAKDIGEFFEYIPGNSNFLYSALYTFTNENAMSYLEKLGVKLKIERGDRVFPKSDKSSDIIKAFEKELKRKNVSVRFGSKVKDIMENEEKIEGVTLEDGSIIKGDYFIICTGGASYPQTGSSGDGYKFAEKLNHKIMSVAPSLVPIEVKEEWVKDLQGLSLKNVEFSIINDKNKMLYKQFGEMIFTHFGVSGPIVLSGSRVINGKENLKVLINLKPALNVDELDKRIQKDFSKYANKDFKNSLDDLLPKKIIDTIIKFSGIDENKKVNSITKEERRRLVHLIQNFTLNIKGLRPIEEAIVTVGGVSVSDIDPSTMKSKLVKNLYFAGEVMDVDAYTGGFNIQIAMSTGFLAGSNVGE